MHELILLIIAIVALLSTSNAADDTESPCILPPAPKNGRFDVHPLSKLLNLSRSFRIDYTCDPGYAIYGSSFTYCIEGAWSDPNKEQPKCLPACQLDDNPNMEYSSCQLRGSYGSGSCSESEPIGTIVQVKCKDPTYQSSGVSQQILCANGSWEYHPVCIPGDFCDTNGTEGICVGVDECDSDSEVVRKPSNSTVCGIKPSGRHVCCPLKYAKLKNKELCRPVTRRRPDMKTGSIAFHKCIEYQEHLLFPCEAHFYQEGGLSVSYHRRDACTEPPPLIVGSEGIDASRGQFPHMALLGYGKELSKVEWLCGGTIISERFILTAGHCTVHVKLGNVTFARLGILKRSDPAKVIRDYAIKRSIKHPDYKPPSKYNDIALLETEKRIVFLNKHIVPACLDVEESEEETEASATGWGALGEWGGSADVLQIMEISRFSDEECSQEYEPHRLLKLGVDRSTQMCYGHRQIPRDTCTGDSGGPLQVEYAAVSCMHKVIGVTSFGKACGKTGRPGVYTRVLPYVPWIEANVWGDDNGAIS